VSDRRLAASTDGTNVDYYDADVTSTTEYYPYGMTLRSESDGGGYRYGFNGYEADNEVKGKGNSFTTEFRQYDSRVARWLSTDPLEAKYPNWSPYAFVYDNPMNFIDIDGREGVPVIMVKDDYGKTIITYKQNLKRHQWHTYQGKADPETFKTAAIYNTQNSNSWAYTDIGERYDYYSWADKQVSDKSKWFAAAAIVTQFNSVGAADGINLWYLNDEAEDFLQKGNKYLFKYNMANSKSLINNGVLTGTFVDANGDNINFEGLIGKSLDYAMVQFEQTKVEDFIKEYKQDNPDANIDNIMESINYSMGATFAPSEIKSVMDEYFNTDKGQEAFDFSNYDHRVKLGQKLVDQFYTE
jgi:RHS repeat-associated protein